MIFFGDEIKGLHAGNSVNEAYVGDKQIFSSGPEPLIIDGLEYRTVKMPDGRIWMAENLQTTIGGKYTYFYNDDEVTYGRNGKNYGRLYRWEDISTLNIPGWHLPTATEWGQLRDAVGGYQVAGEKLKSKNGWDAVNGTDIYGFNVLPAGYRYINMSGNYVFGTAGVYSVFWSSTKYSGSEVVAFTFREEAKLYSTNERMVHYVSVRLIKDN